MKDLIIYKAQINIDLNSDLEVNYMGLVDKPAIEKNFQVFNSHKAKFSIDEAKRIISGPAMICDLPIYRNDSKLGEYLVVFDADCIQCIVEKFSAKGYMKNFNLFHDMKQKADDLVIFNSFISNADLGVMPLKGYEDISDRSWYISAKVNDDATWEKALSGEIKGFSVEGIFDYVPVAKIQMTSQQVTDRINYLLNNIEISD